MALKFVDDGGVAGPVEFAGSGGDGILIGLRSRSRQMPDSFAKADRLEHRIQGRGPDPAPHHGCRRSRPCGGRFRPILSAM